MQRILMLFFSLVFLLLQDKTSRDIVGRWEAMETTRGGLGSTLEFGPDGSFTFPFGPLLHGTYKLDGNNLIFTTIQPPPEKATTETNEIKIERDTLFQKTEYGTHKWDRLSPGAPNSSPIVGRWGMKTSIYEFKRDGTFDVSSSIASSISSIGTDNGTYKLEDNHLYMTVTPYGAKETVKTEMEISGDTLIWRRDPMPNTVMRRISSRTAEGPAIIGRWSIVAADGTDIIGITEYKQNGEWAGSIPIMVRKGRYDIKGDLLTITFDDAGLKISRFRFESGILVLKSPPETGPEDKFKRIE